MSRKPLYEIDKEESNGSSTSTASSIVYFKKDSVVLYTTSIRVGNYKVRLYKSLNMLIKYSGIVEGENDRYALRIEVKKLRALSWRQRHNRLRDEQEYFHDNYMVRWNKIKDVAEQFYARKDLLKLINDPELKIYSLAFRPFLGMKYMNYQNMELDDHDGNFMWDTETKRVIPIDLFI